MPIPSGDEALSLEISLVSLTLGMDFCVVIFLGNGLTSWYISANLLISYICYDILSLNYEDPKDDGLL